MPSPRTSRRVRNNAGGHVNPHHVLKIIEPKGGGTHRPIADAITKLQQLQ